MTKLHRTLNLATVEDDTGIALSLENFLYHFHLDVRNVLSRGPFSQLCIAAAVREDYEEPLEEYVSKALPRLCAIDSRNWIM
ncbi:MAG: hypothetical protein GXY06_03000 [Clostridiaceae bacterium]|nr:hypothetical protein [Clostridiaceae bacterium]